MEGRRAGGGAPEDLGPVEIPCLQLLSGLVGAIVEHHRSTDAASAVTEYGGHVRTTDAVVFKHLVVRRDAHRLHTLLDQVSDGVVRHGGHDGSVEAEAVREVGTAVELAA